MGQELGHAYELTLARDFVEHLDAAGGAEAETGTLAFQVEGTDAASESMAAELDGRPEG